MVFPPQCREHGKAKKRSSPDSGLAGMGRDYLTETIIDFRSHARANTPCMSDLMNATSLDDLAALEEYLAGL